MSDEQPITPAPAPKKHGWPKGKPRTPRAQTAAAPEPLDVPATVAQPQPAIRVVNRRNAAQARRRNDALARRLAGGDPFRSGSKVIPLKEPHRWHLYIGNNYASDDDLYRMVHEYGWDHLELADLACKPEDIGFRVSDDGHLVRGTHGREMIFKMAKEDHKALELKKTERNNATIGKPTKAKAELANVLGHELGAQAGDFADANINVTIKDTLEPRP